jgi:DNA end-binding protein Ku
MARSIWKGTLGFGLVSVPVGVYPATQDKSIHFNQFESGTSDRIRYKKVNERTGQEVEAQNIVKGFDLGGGEYVILTDDELAAAGAEKSGQMEITDFVDLDSIDPLYYRATYFVAPEGKGSDKPYALLRRAMKESNKVAIATLVMRNKEYLVAIRPEGEVLALETMFFADEVRVPEREFPALPDDSALTDRELSMAQLLIESMESEWDPEKFHDTHREMVEGVIEEKRRGHSIVTSEGPSSSAKVVDLMEALNASVRAAATKPAAAKAPSKRAPTKRAPAKKTAKSTPAAKAAPRRKAS